ncbi:MAG: UDP-glucose/GDP-mannose dehydrogenase family protein [Planctomycetota bacterium]|nr:MAG: UDP-glucose/GDP-mannose dehydrogenase family protein [Planctomycetota bacterium]
MRIAVIGAGYVGLVTGTCFADNGNDVWCVDIDADKVARLQRGEIPIYEPGLEEMVKRNLRYERLHFTTDVAEAVANGRIVFLCVGTPPADDGRSDLSYLFRAVEDVGRAMPEHRVVVIKSTVPVGTAQRVREVLAGVTEHEFDVVSNPEFLKEGAAIDDFLKPDRVVIGTDDARVATIMKELYDPFVRTGHPILVMDNASAELTKYGANALLATRISFMNELANLADRVGADISLVRKGMGSDARIGHSFLFPGVGFGGSCFPKDVDALGHVAQDHGLRLRLLEATNAVNRDQKRVLYEKIRARLGDLRGKRIAVWGLAFKPRTDDMREAPSITIIEHLLADGAEVVAYDPVATDSARAVFGERIRYAQRAKDAARGADCLAVVTEWNEFRRPDFEELRDLLAQPLVFDGRNIYDPIHLERLGIEYYGIGRGRRLHPAPQQA